MGLISVAAQVGLVLVAAMVLFMWSSAPATADDAAHQSAEIGTWDSATGEWHLGDERFLFGNIAGQPLLGDWDCDGIATPGIYIDGVAALSNPDLNRVFIGLTGDVALVGDWDGDGCDSLGVYRDGRVMLRNGLANGPLDHDFWFGQFGDRPFSGDFNGDGTTTIGIHRPLNDRIYLSNDLRTGMASTTFFFGGSNDRFVAGDWTGNGTDTVAIYRPATGSLYFRYTNSSGPADRVISVGTPGQALWPIAGQFHQPPVEPDDTPEGPVMFRVNVGGPEIAATGGGMAWAADTNNQPSSFRLEVPASEEPAATATAIQSSDALVGSEVPDPVFGTERNGAMRWSLPVAGVRTLQVNLYFSSAENGFAVVGDDGLIINGLDLAGGSGTRRSFLTTVTDGALDLRFDPKIELPHLSGIEVLAITSTEIVFPSQGPDPSANGDLLRYSLASAGDGFQRVTIGPGLFVSRSGTYELKDGLALVGAPSTTLSSSGAWPLVSLTGETSVTGIDLGLSSGATIGILADGAEVTFTGVSITASAEAAGAAILATDSNVVVRESEMILESSDMTGLLSKDSGIDVMGSVISGAGAAVRADSSTLTMTGVEVTSSDTDSAVGIDLTASSLVASGVNIHTQGRQSAVGVVIDNSVVEMVGGSIDAQSATSSTALSLNQGRGDFSNTSITASGLSPRGAVATNSDLSLNDSAIIVSGTATGIIIENQNSAIDVVSSVLRVRDDAGTGIGIEILSGGFRAESDSAASVNVVGSTLDSGTHIVLNLPGAPVTIADTILVGGIIIDPHNKVTCTNVVDAHGTPLAADCSLQ